MIKGFIDKITDDCVSGWCFDTNDKSKKVAVKVYHDNEIIAEGIANNKRNDLKFIDETAAFAFHIPFQKIENKALIKVFAIDYFDDPQELKSNTEKSIDIENGSEGNLKQILWSFPSTIKKYAFKTTEELINKTGANTGNLAFINALESQIKFSDILPWEKELPDDCKAGVLACANQLGAHCDMGSHAKIVEAAKCPLVAIGLGAQAHIQDELPVIPEGTLKWLSALVEHAAQKGKPNLALRGYFTQRALEHYGFGDAGIVLGCPSLFTNPATNLGKIIEKNFKKPQRVAVCAGLLEWRNLQKIEASLAKIVTETSGAYIAQSADDMIMFARNEWTKLSSVKQEKFRDYVLPGSSLQNAQKWLEDYGMVFFNIDAWMEFYRHFDFVIGARIHGIMLALQAGIPALCIAHDSRTLELCQLMKVPYVLSTEISDGIKLDDLERLFNFDAEEFDNNRVSLHKNYVNFLKDNGIIHK